MILVTRRKGDVPVTWLDTTTRLAYDTRSGVTTSRPFTDGENAAVDALNGATQETETAALIREQLRLGIATITAAKEAAEADVFTAQGLRSATLDVKSAAVAQHDAVTAFTPAATYSAAQMTAVKNALLQIIVRQGQVLDALAAWYQYRVAVDENAVTTDNALIGLARIVSGQLED